jgi:ectoine hydroxylase-related dioxygenase (phytanoyl-CoA dioxygenase family)
MSDANVAAQIIEQTGFAILRGVVNEVILKDLTRAVERLPENEAVRLKGKRPFAIRNLLEIVPLTRQVAHGEPVTSLAKMVLGANLKLVRALFFDKLPEANWKVVWHQDLTIAVKKRMDLEGFGPWTTKAGVTHVQPPNHVLEKMLTVRVHLDDSHAENGALKVISGSHKRGRLCQAGVDEFVKTATATICEVPKGGVLLMRPLLLHASSVSRSPVHRRVLHFEFSSGKLPEGLQWYEQ